MVDERVDVTSRLLPSTCGIQVEATHTMFAKYATNCVVSGKTKTFYINEKVRQKGMEADLVEPG